MLKFINAHPILTYLIVAEICCTIKYIFGPAPVVTNAETEHEEVIEHV